LITGTGKRITKADLVAEARSGNVRYEKQDELEQSVRVWGDTAVVTAKLWEKGLRTEKRLITNFGSVIHTCAHLQDGNTS
jgi:hypothetical protein